ncbi:MAG: BREX system P-loop protein BrxC [Planctomycetota bacterium]
MKIYETLDRDPRTSPLANSGQARILTTTDDRAVQELRAELETFVSDGQYGDALQRILQSYLTQLDRPRQNAAWISGFFGSGKSHLLKVFAHLWVDTSFEDGATARTLVRNIPDDVVAMLRELDTHAARIGKPKVAAAGSLPQGNKEHVRLTVLAVLLRACGFPEQFPQAQFCFWLRDHGYLDPVRSAVEAGGKPWLKELNNLYVSGPIAGALLACDRDFAHDEREARKVLRERFPHPAGDITTSQFLAACREALAPEGDLPPTALVLDEVQQYIGDSTDRAVAVTELAEAVQTQLDSRVLLVASGQSALTATPQLQRLKDRFRITVQLSDTDVEAVTRKVLLHKKASAVEPIRETLERHAGEVSKHLQGSRLAERPSDRDNAVADYPLLSTRRRFWEECFRAVDSAGTHSQLRSQLHILFEGLRTIAPNDLGAVIPADALYDAISTNLVNTGVLLGELATRIREQDDGTEAGRLRRRIGGIVFLIGKLPREAGNDLGVRATPRVVADLLVDDLRTDSGPFRKEVETQLEVMAEAGTLMKVGDEYRLQTTQGAEWDRAFREKVGALRQQLPELQARQDQLLAAAVQEVVGGLRRQHGDARVPRTFHVHARPDAPTDGGEQVVVWLRDGSSSAQREVESEARRRGQEDPVLHVFLPKPGDDLRARIAEAEASRMVLEAKGAPTEPPEAREACESMKSRRAKAVSDRDELVRDLLSAAKVYQGGGSEVFGEGFLSSSSARSMLRSRLFPRFEEGDHRAWWGVAFEACADGLDEPLKVVGWDRPTEEHPVLREVLAQIGAGSKGGEVRKVLKGAPMAGLRTHRRRPHRCIALARYVRRQASAPSLPADQNKISTAELRPERVRLGAKE